MEIISIGEISVATLGVCQLIEKHNNFVQAHLSFDASKHIGERDAVCSLNVVCIEIKGDDTCRPFGDFGVSPWAVHRRSPQHIIIPPCVKRGVEKRNYIHPTSSLNDWKEKAPVRFFPVFLKRQSSRNFDVLCWLSCSTVAKDFGKYPGHQKIFPSNFISWNSIFSFLYLRSDHFFP
jgi:hypothetical protein